MPLFPCLPVQENKRAGNVEHHQARRQQVECVEADATRVARRQPGWEAAGFDLHLAQYADEGWRCTFYTTGKEHSLTATTGTAWEPTPWLAVQRAAARALDKMERAAP